MKEDIIILNNEGVLGRRLDEEVARDVTNGEQGAEETKLDATKEDEDAQVKEGEDAQVKGGEDGETAEEEESVNVYAYYGTTPN